MAGTPTSVQAPGRSVWDGGVSPMGVSYGKLMMWFFLLSDAFTFSALLVTYGLVRSSHPGYDGVIEDFIFSQAYWPIPEKVFEAVPFFDIHAPLVFVGIMTFILIMSSVTMVLAVEAGHRMDRAAVEKWMLWTIIGGLTFLGCQAWEWSHFIHGAHSGPAVAKDFRFMAQVHELSNDVGSLHDRHRDKEPYACILEFMGNKERHSKFDCCNKTEDTGDPP